MTASTEGPRPVQPTEAKPRRAPAVDGPNDWFSAQAEAANCERILGNKKHGLDNLLPKRTSAQGRNGTPSE